MKQQQITIKTARWQQLDALRKENRAMRCLLACALAACIALAALLAWQAADGAATMRLLNKSAELRVASAESAANTYRVLYESKINGSTTGSEE